MNQLCLRFKSPRLANKKKRRKCWIHLPASEFIPQVSWVVRSKLECQRLMLSLLPCFRISHIGILVLLQSSSILLVVFAPNFKVASCVVTDWAFLRSFAALMYVTAVSALPFDNFVFFEYCALFNVC